MRIQITNVATGGKSEVMDFSELTLDDLRVILKYSGTIKIERK